MMGLSGMGRRLLHTSGPAGASAMFNADLVTASIAC